MALGECQVMLGECFSGSGACMLSQTAFLGLICLRSVKCDKAGKVPSSHMEAAGGYVMFLTPSGQKSSASEIPLHKSLVLPVFSSYSSTCALTHTFDSLLSLHPSLLREVGGRFYSAAFHLH